MQKLAKIRPSEVVFSVQKCCKMLQIAMARAPVSVMKCCHTTLKSDRFLAIFMEHRLNTQHSQLHSLL